MTIKLALCGRMRSGKDAIAEYLVTTNYGFHRLAFADEMKRYYHELFGPSKSKPREGYQWFGETMRSRDESVWIRKMFDNIEEKKHQHDVYHDFPWTYGNPDFNVVVTDLRLPLEYDALIRKGFVIIRVTAPEDLRIQRMISSGDTFNPDDLTHDTESYVDSFEVDYEITNAGTLGELYAQVDEFMAELLTDRQR